MAKISILDKKHPGFNKRKRAEGMKGRPLDDTAHHEVMDLLGNRAVIRDELIEYLHLIQDAFGHIHARHIKALADIMKLAEVEITEVASFYAHFDIIKEGQTPPPATTIRVCDSLSCMMAGCETLITQCEKANMDGVRIKRAPCMGRCHQAPVAEVGHNHITEANLDKIQTALKNNDTHHHHLPAKSLADYEKDGGYKLLQNIKKDPKALAILLEELNASNLRGLGGAGFPTARKWNIVKQFPKPRMMAVNADEGEPGTIKDYHYLKENPHQFLEGMLIGAFVVEAEAVYIYLRDEYPDIRELLQIAIGEIANKSFASHTKIHLRRGAGAYICGEESAMLESIEGKRGLPRHRPPFVAEVGLFGRPTLVNNVETLYWVRPIADKGGAWFQSHGLNGRKGLRSFSVSGRVKNPGVKLAPAGINIRQLIDDYCGGMADGHQFTGYLPGGASGGILPASMDDIALDFDTLQAHGCFIGSAAVVVLSQRDNMKDVALNLMKFFKDESCGQCTPCRVGTEKAVLLMQEKQWNKSLLLELSQVMVDASICGLGQAAPNPLLSVIKHFGA